MIRKIAGLILLGLAVPLLVAASGGARIAANDWTRRVTLSPIGGHVMGNPAASTRLVEYVSYTCVHCAHFTNDAHGALRIGWVQRGTLNVEVRNAVRDPFDLAAAMLARCGGKDRFFGNHAAIFANYDAWMTQINAYGALAPNPALKTEAQKLTDIADKTGLFTLMQGRGFNRRQLSACMTDKNAQARILGMSGEAWQKLKIGGTPSFTLNGRLLDDVHDWNSLRVQLPAQSVPATTV